MMELAQITRNEAVIMWDEAIGAQSYRIYWSDREGEQVRYQMIGEIPADQERVYRLKKSTHRPHYLKLVPVIDGKETAEELFVTPVHYIQKEQLEQLKRGLIAVPCREGVFLSWRLFLTEVTGVREDGRGLDGVGFVIYRNGESIAEVNDSMNYLDIQGGMDDQYSVAPVINGNILSRCECVNVWENGYYDIPIQKPADGITPAGEAFTYSANDMSVADVDGDGEYEYIVKWDPSNSHDVSIKGYTGHCYLDCYKLDGELMWRLDMGENIRAGAHYTQFICYDFNGDGQAEMAVKTAPGTKMTIFFEGKEKEQYITIPEKDMCAGITHEDSYVCSAEDYYEHLVKVFQSWHEQPEVISGTWPSTLEECFGTEQRFEYPLSEQDARQLTDYFIDVYAKERSDKNCLREFEGFIYEGPEYLTMFAGNGEELETIEFPVGRTDDGLRWGDYAMKRIEPCNRVDRFLSGVAYLDGERPYLIVCRGYYTRSTLTAYRFFENKFETEWKVDSGFVPMNNPFHDNPHLKKGEDPVYGKLAGQGNHSLATADVDGDGCMEIIYGAACIDHDGSLLYSSYGMLPDGREAKFGHGDAMHVADIDPDRPGLEIFNVFEEGINAPYGYALRHAENGEVVFGEYAEEDLGRCMIGDIHPNARGLQCWVNGKGTYDCHGTLLEAGSPGSNMSIRWASDLTTQITDGEDYLHETATGVISDMIHGEMLRPENTLTNNGTKGNPCLVADIFGDFREEILLRTSDSSAIRIYSSTELTEHKLFTLMHDVQYRCGVAWQNNCYNQPGYTEFYYASDMDLRQVLPEMKRKPVLYLAGDSTAQSYHESERPQTGWGEKLVDALEAENCWKEAHRDSSPFSQEMSYETRHIIVDNCAMAGRSSRSFREEGRLEDIKNQMKSGDYLLIQFGHNDAAAEKKERYVPLETFGESLMEYIRVAREKKAYPILISSICLRPCLANEQGENAKIDALLPKYAEEMKKLADKENIPYVDMLGITRKACAKAGEEQTAVWYREDNVHLQEAGAQLYAHFVAEEIKKLIGKE